MTGPGRLDTDFAVERESLALASPAALSSVTTSRRPAAHRQRFGRLEHLAPARRRLRRGCPGRGVRGRRRLRIPGEFGDGFAAALGACAGLSLLGARAGLALPARRGANEGAATPVAAARAAELDS
jgi:hypothetical protein